MLILKKLRIQDTFVNLRNLRMEDGGLQISSFRTVSVFSLLRKILGRIRLLYNLTPCNSRTCKSVSSSSRLSVISRSLFDFMRSHRSFTFSGQKFRIPFLNAVFFISSILRYLHLDNICRISITFTVLFRLAMLRTCNKLE